MYEHYDLSNINPENCHVVIRTYGVEKVICLEGIDDSGKFFKVLLTTDKAQGLEIGLEIARKEINPLLR
jgi:hypothetical protein